MRLSTAFSGRFLVGGKASSPRSDNCSALESKSKRCVKLRGNRRDGKEGRLNSGDFAFYSGRCARFSLNEESTAKVMS